MKTARMFAVFAAISVASSSFGQTIFTYAFADVTTSSGSTTLGGTASNLTFSGFTASGVSTNSNAAGVFAFTSWSSGAIDASNTFTGAMEPTDYYQFSITPNGGYTYSLSSLNFAAGRTPTGPRQFVVRSSADNYASNLSASAASPLTIVGSNVFQFTDNSSTNLVTGQSITLSSGSFSNLTGTTTFRIFAYNAESTGSFRIDNLGIAGSSAAAVPEPSTYAAIFGAVALVGAAIHRRRQRAKAVAF